MGSSVVDIGATGNKTCFLKENRKTFQVEMLNNGKVPNTFKLSLL
jgi:hypothetical protein